MMEEEWDGEDSQCVASKMEVKGRTKAKRRGEKVELASHIGVRSHLSFTSILPFTLPPRAPPLPHASKIKASSGG